MNPTNDEILQYLNTHKSVNYTKLAKRFKLENHVIPFLLSDLISQKKISVKKFGTSRLVELK